MVFAWWNQRQQAHRAYKENQRVHKEQVRALKEKIRAAQLKYEDELLELTVDFYYFLFQQPGVREALGMIVEEAETLAETSPWIRQTRRREDSIPPTLALLVDLQQASEYAAKRYHITAVRQAIKTTLRRVESVLASGKKPTLWR